MHAKNATMHAHVIPTTTFQFGFIKFILRNAKQPKLLIIKLILLNYNAADAIGFHASKYGLSLISMPQYCFGFAL